MVPPEAYPSIKAWQMVAAGGRDAFSTALRIEAIISVLESIGGSQDDIQLVFEIDNIFKDVNSGIFRKTKNSGPGID